MKISHFVGAVGLIAGTSIGGAILSLPVSTAQYGFLPIVALLISCWLFMTYSALLILEVNTNCHRDANLISMARASLGKAGVVVTWIAYLLLLYALMAAYLSGLSAMTVDMSHHLHQPISVLWSAILLTAVFSLLIYAGTSTMDMLNRLLMLTMLISFSLILLNSLPHVHAEQLFKSGPIKTWHAAGITITSFGFAIIIPSLRRYCSTQDEHRLPMAIRIGSMIPLVAYLVWVAMMRSSLSSTTLRAIAKTGQPATGLVNALTTQLHLAWMSHAFESFTWAIITTSFIGVSLSLFDCLQDGCKIACTRKGRLLTVLLTMVPPAIFAECYPQGFILALHYASFFVAILLGLLPTCMAWRQRLLGKHGSYQAPGGTLALACNGLFFLAVIALEINAL